MLLLNLRFDRGEGLEGVDGDVEIEGGEAEDGCERDINIDEDDCADCGGYRLVAIARVRLRAAKVSRKARILDVTTTQKHQCRHLSKHCGTTYDGHYPFGRSLNPPILPELVLRIP